MNNKLDGRSLGGAWGVSTFFLEGLMIVSGSSLRITKWMVLEIMSLASKRMVNAFYILLLALRDCRRHSRNGKSNLVYTREKTVDKTPLSLAHFLISKAKHYSQKAEIGFRREASDYRQMMVRITFRTRAKSRVNNIAASQRFKCL
jgi:hypothetical protein